MVRLSFFKSKTRKHFVRANQTYSNCQTVPTNGCEAHTEQHCTEAEILKVVSDKPPPPSKPKATPSVLFPELASVDLTEIIGDEEVNYLPRPRLRR
jgi:hypothetical protein